MTTATKAATITGTFITPGVSSNGRLYTKETIGKAVARMQAAIESGTAPPISQMTSHDTDDVLNTVGRITKVWQSENGDGKYEADAPPTERGREVATLAKYGYASNVSVVGRWLGNVENIEHDGAEVETADDMEIMRVDYVPRGGVTGARVDAVVMAEAAPEDFRDEFLTEILLAEGGPVYADPGLRADRVKRYRLRDKADAEKAWSHINQPAVAEKYSLSDLTKVKANITAALKEYGIPTAAGASPDGDGQNKTEITKEKKVTEEAKPEGISDADVQKIGAALVPSLAEAIREALKSAPVAEPVKEAPATPPVAETEDERFARYFEAKKAELVAAVVKEHGLPVRTGVVAQEGQSKPLHEMSAAELQKASREVAEALIQPGVKYPGVNRENE